MRYNPGMQGLPPRIRSYSAAWIAVLLVLSCEPRPPGVEVFRGEYTWNDGQPSPLEAVFTPAGESKWNVELSWSSGRRKGTYRGRARGSLQQGELVCDVENKEGEPNYRIEAQVDGDLLEGQHYEVHSGRRKPSGTLRLERVR